MKVFALLSLLFLSIHPLISQVSPPSNIEAAFIDEAIKLDGDLSEPAWLNANRISNFTQRELNEGEPVTEKTEVAIVYSKNEMHIGIWCYDSEPDKLVSKEMSRDFNWGVDDNFEIIISPFNDNRNGYLFVTNPNGALADVWVGEEGKEFNIDWNGVWDVAVERNDQGWFAEMVIPFSTLKFKKESTQVWAINFERNIRRKNEQVMWQGWSRLYELEMISKAGRLTGLENIEQKTKIELNPYLLGGFEFAEENSKTGKIGGEINFDITPTLKLNFTVNTDFAQVESDRKQINLSRFSIRYPEKRQFFLEGKNYYDMDVGKTSLFYSRRIGIDQHSEVPIIGGTRFFGKLDKTNIGVMSLQTYASDSVPTTNYSVMKVSQDIFKQSSIGFITTQKYSEKGYNGVYGTNFIYSTSELFGDKNLRVGGSFAATDTKLFGETETVNGDNLSYDLFLTYHNDVIEYDLGFTTVEKGFNPEMGFINRGNYQEFTTELQFNPRFEKLTSFRNLILKPIDINYYINNETKETESIFYEWRPFGFVTKSGEFAELNIQHRYDAPTTDFELIDSIFIPAGEYWDNRVEIQFESFRGRRISGEVKASAGDFYTGHRQELELATHLNLNRHLNIRIDWERNFIQLPEKSLITDELGGRIEYAFNPKLNTSIFAQWNNEDDVVLVNYRINWIPKIGSFFYFVINQAYDTNNGFKLERTTVLGKLIWRFAI